jgi:hypothetical protein
VLGICQTEGVIPHEALGLKAECVDAESHFLFFAKKKTKWDSA